MTENGGVKSLTLMDLFKRSSKKWSATWLSDDEGEHDTIKLTQTGYIEYNMRIEVIAEDLISIIEGTTKDGSNAKKYFQSLCRRSGKSKEDNLRDFEKYSTTTMVRGADTAIGTADAPREENAAVEVHKLWPSEDSL